MPANSIALRTVGKIYPLSGATVTVNLFPERPTNTVVLRLLNQSNADATNVTGTGTLTLTCTALAAEYHTLRLQNASAANAEQRVYVKATYTAPRDLRAPPVITQPMLTPNAEFQFSVTERQGFNYVVEGSTNLTSWLSLKTNVAPFIFVDGAPTNRPARFYRARYGP